jgi:16S rRNA (guanine527-N7)-methyltransferase
MGAADAGNLPSFESLLSARVDGRVLSQMVRYAELLERWSARHNLVCCASREELVARHLMDALAAARFVPAGGRLLDVGSGGGLPGVPLLVTGEGVSGVLLEPRQKRWAFLRTVIRELQLPARAERSRYQEFTSAERWDMVTLRALGGQAEVLQWARVRLAPRGWVVVWTTERGEAKLRELGGWRVLSSPLPGLERGRLVRLQSCFT